MARGLAAIGFVLAHPAITSAILGPRTMEQFDHLLAGVVVSLDDVRGVDASNAAAILAEGVASIMPRTLLARPFSPALHDITVQIGLPAVQPNLHAEKFAQLLHDEAKRVASALAVR